MHIETPAPTQTLNATVAQFRDGFQYVFGLAQAPLVKVQVHVTVLEREHNRRRNVTMILGRYAPCMAADIERITKAVTGVEAHSTVIET